MKKVLIPFRFGNINDYFKDEKNNPNEFLYGTHDLISKDEVDIIFCPRGKRDTVLRWLSFFFQKPFTMMAYLGMPVEIVLENLSKCKKAETVFCINDPISLAFLFCKKIGLIRCDLVTMFQSITERRIKFFSRNLVLLSFYKWLIKGSDKVLVLSQAAKDELVKSFSVDERKIQVYRFGADLSFWDFKGYDEKRENFILSVGNDMNRDFDTLINALAAGHQIVLVSNKKNITHKNIKVVSGISNIELKELYQKAKAVVTPSFKLKTESSGLSTTVQAMACGTPVFLSDTPAIEEMFDRDKEIFFFKAEDPKDLNNVLTTALGNPDLMNEVSKNARAAVEERFNSGSMNLEIRKILSN